MGLAGRDSILPDDRANTVSNLVKFGCLQHRPTAHRTQDSLAVTTRWGKAKLARASPPPALKSAAETGTASGCPGCLAGDLA